MSSGTHEGLETAPVASIDTNRKLPIVVAATIPSPPAGWTPTPPDERAKRLRVMGEEVRAEGREALLEAGANPDAFAKDLGDLAPDASPAGPLASRLQDVQAALARTEALAACLREQRDIALSDAVLFLEAANTELEHRVSRFPELGTKYPKLVRFFDARKRLIADGIARAKAAKLPQE